MVSTRSDEISSKGSNLETEKGRAIFVLYATLPLNLIIIAIMIHQDISYSNLHMAGTRSVKTLIKERERDHFCMQHTVLTSYKS